MADACENLPESSSDRKVDLLRSYCDAYDQMSKEELPKLKGKAKLDKLNEMAGVLNQIEEIQKERQSSPQETSIETKKITPFKVMAGSYCDIDVLGGFADGRYSVVDVQLATSNSTPDYREEGFVSRGFTRYDINFKMDRKNNFYTKKPIYVHYEQNTARLEIGFEGKMYSIAIPKNSITREGMVTSHPGIHTYRESTTISAPIAIDIGSSGAKLHLVLDVGEFR